MELILVGYGKMGKAIEKVAEGMNITVAKVINSPQELLSFKPTPKQIAIEFTSPDQCIRNVEILAKKKISVVCGTTGWYQDIHKMKNIVKENNIGFLYAENFSLGVHLFWESLSKTARLLNKTNLYDVSTFEEHHANKKDAPSGTAKKTAEILIQNFDTKNKFQPTDKKDEIFEKNIVPILYSRKGNVFGQHTVTFESDLDTIEITHNSKGREGYASGATKCAQWLKEKKGFFHIEDYLKTI
ncbi:MAG: 4-hydroxy-tetrahydrodipicolinate reductase [Alphaproteobacteria bacterium]|nr:4-hydroxy-tetrahydrodipicolinate reductase [Alphaproteobacteria bacterium]